MGLGGKVVVVGEFEMAVWVLMLLLRLSGLCWAMASKSMA